VSARAHAWASVMLVAACASPAPDLDASASDAWASANDAARGDALVASDAWASDAFVAHDAASAPDVGTQPPCPTGAYFCDDFESAALASTWSLDASDGTAVIETTAAHGHGALHVHVASHAGARAMAQNGSFFPVAGNSFYARAYVRLASPAPTVHVGMIDASGESIEIRLGLGPTLLPNYSGPGVEYGSWAADPPLMPVDAWTCLEWAVLDDPSSNHDRLLYWIDGTEQTAHEIDGTGTDAWRVPVLDRVEIGLILYHDDAAGMAHDAWYDDLVIAPSRVGCD